MLTSQIDVSLKQCLAQNHWGNQKYRLAVFVQEAHWRSPALMGPSIQVFFNYSNCTPCSWKLSLLGFLLGSCTFHEEEIAVDNSDFCLLRHRILNCSVILFFQLLLYYGLCNMVVKMSRDAVMGQCRGQETIWCFREIHAGKIKLMVLFMFNPSPWYHQQIEDIICICKCLFN